MQAVLQLQCVILKKLSRQQDFSGILPNFQLHFVTSNYHPVQFRPSCVVDRRRNLAEDAVGGHMIWSNNDLTEDTFLVNMI